MILRAFSAIAQSIAVAPLFEPSADLPANSGEKTKEQTALYIFDTNCWSEGWSRVYPQTVFPRYWQFLADEIANGRLISPTEVLDELRDHHGKIPKSHKGRAAKSPDSVACSLMKWIGQQQNHLFCKLSDKEHTAIENEVADISNQYSGLLKKKGRPGADPHVIAYAIRRGGTVVTFEKPNQSGQTPNKIPTVCRELKVRCLTPSEHMKERGYSDNAPDKTE